MRIYITLFLFAAVLSAKGQFPETYTSADIYHQLLKANKFGSVLYIAAHPDDENTRLISYFENHLKARTAYLSLTRGDGGQNLIGTEIGPAVGVLRTQELLGARAIDGGEQFFSRAVDFGYSKSSLETLEKWGKQALLHDVVWVIRKFQPDVLVTRFPPNNYAGHGHHEASALLAEEAFDLAGDPSAFPEQLEFVKPWSPKRLYFNASSWWVDNLVEKAKGSDNYLQINVGDYNPLIGESYAQMAARSRSEHKSQGFGSDFPYGLNIEYLEFVKGSKAIPNEGILSGIETGWERLDGSIGKLMESVLNGYNHSDPSKSIPALIDVLRGLHKLPLSQLRDNKIIEIEDLIVNMAGVRLEAASSSRYYTPGERIPFRVGLIQNQQADVILKSIQYRDKVQELNATLVRNELFSQEFVFNLPNDEPLGNPYWLNQPYEALYSVSDYNMLGSPENKPSLEIVATLELYGYQLNVRAALSQKIVDPVKAVRYWPVRVVPKVTFNFSESCIIMAGNRSKEISVFLKNNADSAAGQLMLRLPQGWTSTPKMVAYSSSARGEVQRFEFLVETTVNSVDGDIEVLYNPLSGDSFSALGVQEIEYDHIPAQIILSEAKIPIRSIPLDHGHVKLVGYIDGPGDDVAKYLLAVGYAVEKLMPEQIQAGDLNKYDAILTGIRAFNTRPELAYLNKALNEYVANGGTWIVQYNTSRGLQSEEIGPYPFEISRERVTDEHAIPQFLIPDHKALLSPNKLSLTDFDGWVQERGLYFAGSRDPKFEALITWSDAGEPLRDGGLILAPYGKGYFVYTGISFFRQLPAGVPGAYRLMANLMSLSHNQESSDE